jgi:hypothetical protein
LIRHAKKQAGRGWYFHVTNLPSIDPPGNNRCLKAALKVDHLKHGKPDHPHDEETWYAVRKDGGRVSRQRNQEEANAILQWDR